MMDSFKLDRRRPKLPTSNDPSLPSTAPKNLNDISNKGFDVPKKRFLDYFYNRETQEYCGRTCTSWACIIAYAFLYLTFICTYTLILLYLSLYFIKEVVKFKQLQPMSLTYPEEAIGLTATPSSEDSYPLIWYKDGEENEYEKYVKAINKLLVNNRNKSDAANLGPCGLYPYGYGSKPCIIIKINKQFYWSGKPLQTNSTATKLAPPEVKTWIKSNSNRLWLQCNGYHSYDKEHIGSIKYYPHPPGFDPDLFPLDKEGKSPLIAIQISEFTKGISLAIECSLWYEKGPSTVAFVLYVAPDDSITISPRFNNIKI